jgi:hypothetical protein
MSALEMQFSDEGERLFVEQAQAMYRELREHARQAPDGQVLDRAEQLAMVRGRELTRKALQSVTQTEIVDLEKKLRQLADADAAASVSIAAAESGKSSRRRARLR